MLHSMGEWIIGNDQILTFTVEISIFVGFVIISILLFLLHHRFPQITRNGWIELVIGAPFIALKGLFDALDTINDSLHDIFDSLEASFLLIGLVLLGIGLLRIALYSAKVWEVR
ncbi:MAG TPA: hypothetical protein VMX55_11865 [candidate division Zixibacteria bacterium]|nr:hypothetical protein [candidate division Zixibacteria bacterium]